MSEILGLRNHNVTVDGSSLSLTFDGRWGEQITVSMLAGPKMEWEGQLLCICIQLPLRYLNRLGSLLPADIPGAKSWINYVTKSPCC